MSTSNESNAFVRRFLRYRVANLRSLISKIDKGRTKEQLVTMSSGGCGFYSADPNLYYEKGKRVFSTFEFVGPYGKIGPITTQGNLVFVKPLQLDSGKYYFYGVEFIPESRQKVEPLIKVLDDLYKKNQIRLAS